MDDRQLETGQPSSEDGGGKNRNLLIMLVCLLLAAAGIFGIIKMRNRTPAGPDEINKLGSVNRLALTDTCSLYIDDDGRLNTMGTVPPLDDYDGVVQISAFDGHLLGLGLGRAPCMGLVQRFAGIGRAIGRAVRIDERGAGNPLPGKPGVFLEHLAAHAAPRPVRA